MKIDKEKFEPDVIKESSTSDQVEDKITDKDESSVKKSIPSEIDEEKQISN